ncbi:MAG: hypothetical protein ABIE94_01260 [archaeon]
MRKIFSNKGLYLILIILVLIIVFLGIQTQNIHKEKTRLQSDFSEYKSTAAHIIKELEKTIVELEEKNQALNSSLSQLEEQHSGLTESYENLEVSYTNAEAKVEETLGKIDYYEEKLNESMEWYKSNSIVTGYMRGGAVVGFLESNCLQVAGDYCYIKSGCFYLVNSEFLHVEYALDEELSGREDKLQSLDEFISNKGGDCEDYALFYKAEYNSLLENCEEDGGKKVIIEAWQPSNEIKNRYWVTYKQTWYLDDVEKITLDYDGFLYPNIVCGNMYDLNTHEVGGHCVVAFTTEKIDSADDLNLLDSAPLIESQDGSYMGKINGESSGIYMVDYLNAPGKSFISQVITDSDFFLFSSQHREWLSYSIFYQELDYRKILLANIVK